MNSSRISIGAKSPLTGTIKESNAGGTVAAALGHLGITAVIIESGSQGAVVVIEGRMRKAEDKLPDRARVRVFQTVHGG